MASNLLRVVILGPPGLAKGTMCLRITQNFGLQHLLRNLWKNKKGHLHKSKMPLHILSPSQESKCRLDFERHLTQILADF